MTMRPKTLEFFTFVLLLVVLGRLLFSQSSFGRLQNQRKRSTHADQTALTMCTTFSDNPARYKIHELTVYNWAALRPRLRPVLFAGNISSKLSVLAAKFGWEVHRIESSDSQGLPFINYLFNHIQKKYDSYFYGYANGDVLFSHSLTQTMYAAQRHIEEQAGHEKYLFIGQRKSVNYQDVLKQDKEFWRPGRVSEYSCTKVKHPDPMTTLDFFITSPYALPWDVMPQLVVGKTRYDNYILMVAMYLFNGTVDVTGTVHNLHLRGRGRSGTHQDNPLRDRQANRRTIIKFGYVRFETGSIDYCKYLTRNTKQGITLGRYLRRKIPRAFRAMKANARRMMMSGQKRLSANITKQL